MTPPDDCGRCRMKGHKSIALYNETIKGSFELLSALEKTQALTGRIYSKRAMRTHIIRLAKQYGFDIFLTPAYGYEELTIKTRLKHAKKYGKTPTTRMLVISRSFVKNITRIYKSWPALGEFFLRTALWHEYRHLHQDITTTPDFKKREDDANRFMLEKMGRPGLIVSLWYYALHRKTGYIPRFLNKETSQEQVMVRERVINCLQKIYTDLVQPEHYEEITDDVLRLEHDYQLHRNNSIFFFCRHFRHTAEQLFFKSRTPGQT
jgi:hypothetical protein